MWSGTERSSGADLVGDLGVLGVDLAAALGHGAASDVHPHRGGDSGGRHGDGLADLFGDLVGGELTLVGGDELSDSRLAVGDLGVLLAGTGLGLLVAGVHLGEGFVSELHQLGGDLGQVGDSGVELTVGHGRFLSAHCAYDVGHHPIIFEVRKFSLPHFL